MLGKPPVIFRRRLTDVLYAVKAAGFPPVRMCIVDLDLVALTRPAGFPIFGMEVHSGIRTGLCHYVGLKLKIPEAGILHRPGVVEMTPRALGHNHSIPDTEGCLVLAGFPAFKSFSVEQ